MNLFLQFLYFVSRGSLNILISRVQYNAVKNIVYFRFQLIFVNLLSMKSKATQQCEYIFICVNYTSNLWLTGSHICAFPFSHINSFFLLLLDQIPHLQFRKNDNDKTREGHVQVKSVSHCLKNLLYFVQKTVPKMENSEKEQKDEKDEKDYNYENDQNDEKDEYSVRRISTV